LNHPVDYKVLITMFDSRLRHSFNMLNSIRNLYKDKLLDTIVHANVKLKESIIYGRPVVNYDKYSRGTKDYVSLSREIIHKAKTKPGEELREVLASSLAAKEFIERSFALIAPQAKAVYITGDFNNWNAGEENKLILRDGRWERKVYLKKGTYRYKFIVDGLWRHDPNNPHIEKNAFGSFDSIIEVK